MADYPISNIARRVVYTNTGVGPYAFTFEILQNTDIAVYRASTLLTLTTDYTVTINANGTGSITLVVSGTGNITIVGSRAIQRTSDYTTGGDLFASTLNTDLDSQTIYAQQVAETAERGLKAPVVDPTDINMTLPAKATRVGTVLAFNATTGNPEAGPSIASLATVAAQSANINTVATNIASVNTVAGNISNVNTVAGVSGNVTTVAGISANVTTVAGISANVTTVAGNNANVSTVAGISANVTTVAGINAAVSTVATNNAAVSTVATNIADVSTVATNIASVNTNATNIVAIQNASTNATNAATSATNAANSATAAQSAQTAAEAALDSFTDTYLGAFATDPTLDNDGNALTAGDLYFNTGINRLKVYSGATWSVAVVDTTTVVEKTSATGAAVIPAGTTGQRDASPVNGYLRYNSTLSSFEGYVAGAWGAVGGGGVTSFQTSLNGLTPSTASTGVVTLAGTLGATSGGTSQSTYTTGDILYASGSNTLSKLTVGTAGQVLTVASGAPSWATASGGQYFGSAAVKAIAYNSNTIAENVTVTAGNNGLSAGPITINSTFTVTVDTGAVWVIV